ncbi:hypothetical protein SK128_006926, partial [Halocaridina rubra]
SSTDRRGSVVELFIDDNFLVLWIDGTSTRLNPYYGTWSLSDMKLCLLLLHLDFAWSVISGEHPGSDHPPNVIREVSHL